MNRKLQHTVMALSATATVFTMLLLAGGRAPASVGPSQPAALMVLSTGVADDGDAASVDGAAGDTDADSVDSGRRSHLRRTRAALALPYFSFAQGLRRLGS
jgi:hypothetical protein